MINESVASSIVPNGDDQWSGLPPVHIPRHRLTEPIISSTAPIVVVVAGAGYGKSVLLREIALHGRSPLAVVGPLSKRTNQTEFCTAVIAAVADLIGRPLAPLFEAHDGTAHDDLLLALLTESSQERPGSVAIAIDDYHLVADGRVHESVRRLAERLPAGVRLLLASRTDPPLPLARWELEGRACVIRADNLVYRRHEIETVLRKVADFDVSTSTVDAVATRTVFVVVGIFAEHDNRCSRSAPVRQVGADEA